MNHPARATTRPTPSVTTPANPTGPRPDAHELSMTIDPTATTLARPRRVGRRRRGFSMVELLIALTISATLLTSMLVALDAIFRSYTMSSESASTHVISRSVMHRVMSMIRAGREFGPIPVDVTDPAQNNQRRNVIEFVRRENGNVEIQRLIVRAAGSVLVDGVSVQQRGPNVLWLEIDRTDASGARTFNRQPLIDGVLDCGFTTLWDVGPRLRRATVDITVRPQGNTFARYNSDRAMWEVSRIDEASGNVIETRFVASAEATPVIRLVASTGPRGVD